ncbi:MAG: aspartate carbamoyltransferase catalytic subunit [Labilithrix sp.]|nr:aspartate carbamoyltransferase catalytic subunit [Labilithrix sp.]MCW5834225.1 aspartate carbamoyltransferase catalytic subunit [Labilithrix sp.]
MWTHRHLLGIEDLSADDVDAVLDHADTWFERSRGTERKAALLKGRTIINLFFESSTRTRTSFEAAGKRLGADVVNVSSSGSSVSKGETLLDTAKNLEAMRADALVVRHSSSGAPAFLAGRVSCAIVNAGDGAHEHPTQALLDAFTIRRAKGRLDGLVVAICGDITRSRVARSNAILLGKKGAKVRLTGPRTMLPTAAETLGSSVTVLPRLEAAIEGADVVMMLRIQNERFADGGRGSAVPPMSTTREYARTFGLNAAKLASAKPDAIVMHPGPINRGVELDPYVADGERSVILDQVEAGVAVRMAVLELLLAPRAA